MLEEKMISLLWSWFKEKIYGLLYCIKLFLFPIYQYICDIIKNIKRFLIIRKIRPMIIDDLLRKPRNKEIIELIKKRKWKIKEEKNFFQKPYIINDVNNLPITATYTLIIHIPYKIFNDLKNTRLDHTMTKEDYFESIINNSFSSYKELVDLKSSIVSTKVKFIAN